MKSKRIDLLSELRGFKFLTPLVLELKKIESDDETKYSIFYPSSKAEMLNNESDIDDALELTYITITSNIQKSWGKSQDLIIDSVIGHIINISMDNP